MKEIIDQYNKFRDINQKLKNISSVYYIHDSGYILMNSLVPFIEKVAILNKGIAIDNFYNKAILPNQTFEFTSNALKSKMEAKFIEKDLFLQADVKKGSKIDGDKVELTISNLELDISNIDMVSENLIDESWTPFYSNLELIYGGINDQEDFVKFTDDEFSDIVNSKVAYITDSYFTITKHIFMSIKKTDSIYYKVLHHRDIDNDKKRYVLFRKDTDLMSIYTLAAFMVF